MSTDAKENMLEVLMYLFENYMVDGSEIEPDQETLTAELAQAGFRDGEINKAFSWLEDLSEMCEQAPTLVNKPSDRSVRHFAQEEILKLNSDSRNLLMSLENSGVLDPHTREMVIDRVMALEVEEVDSEHFKWVVMMVLCNRPDSENACAWAEALISDESQATVH